jgi:hypothetical protein
VNSLLTSALTRSVVSSYSGRPRPGPWRPDRTARQVRLAQLLPEFAGRRSDHEIRACADAVLDDFDDIPVRSYIVTLAARRTQQCLSAEVCDELAVRAR